MLIQILAVIAGLSSAIMFAYLGRAILKRPAAIAESPYPAYVRHSYNLSHMVTLCAALPWAIAAVVGFNTADLNLIVGLLASPFAFMLLIMQYTKKWSERNPELIPPAMKGAQARVEQLAAWQKSGQISQLELMKRTREIQKEVTKNDALGR